MLLRLLCRGKAPNLSLVAFDARLLVQAVAGQVLSPRRDHRLVACVGLEVFARVEPGGLSVGVVGNASFYRCRRALTE